MPEQVGEVEAHASPAASGRTGPGVMATPAPAKRVAPVRGSGKVCRGWNTRVGRAGLLAGSQRRDRGGAAGVGDDGAVSGAVLRAARVRAALGGASAAPQLRPAPRNVGDRAVGHADEVEVGGELHQIARGRATPGNPAIPRARALPAQKPR